MYMYCLSVIIGVHDFENVKSVLKSNSFPTLHLSDSVLRDV